MAANKRYLINLSGFTPATKKENHLKPNKVYRTNDIFTQPNITNFERYFMWE